MAAKFRGIRFAFSGVDALIDTGHPIVRGVRASHSRDDRLVDTGHPQWRGLRFGLKEEDVSSTPKLRGVRFSFSGTAASTALVTHEAAPDVDAQARSLNQTNTTLPGIYRAPPEPNQRMRHGKFFFNTRIRFTKRRKV